jgi:polyhydroxybutyrate depolymerase
MLYVTGTSDTMNPLDGGLPKFAKTRRKIGGRAKPPVAEFVKRWADLLACPTSPLIEKKAGVERRRFGPCRGGTEVELVLVDGTGHVWPGGRNKAPEWMMGPDSGTLDATAEIWRFFEKHPRPADD